MVVLERNIMSLTKQECEAFWSKADKNGDGKLTIQELDQGLRSILPPGKGPSSKDVVSCVTDNSKVHELELAVGRSMVFYNMFYIHNLRTYRCMDSGSFSKGCDVKKVADAIMEEADTSGDGAIDLKEFLKVSHGNSLEIKEPSGNGDGFPYDKRGTFLPDCCVFYRIVSFNTDPNTVVQTLLNISTLHYPSLQNWSTSDSLHYWSRLVNIYPPHDPSLQNRAGQHLISALSVITSKHLHPALPFLAQLVTVYSLPSWPTELVEDTAADLMCSRNDSDGYLIQEFSTSDGNSVRREPDTL
ncbi:hypothetical protein MAR_006828 [Mya arenaria]|uniref:EF-hand domain-containing protein n=1 Tax=Mya arenaria TaxID=6604 RepID=A0ABY7D9N3_MYAAR|nr:hypothetical protein MAR_006828 [Mya arenaria]